MPAVVQMTPEQLGVWFAGLQQMSFAEPLKVLLKEMQGASKHAGKASPNAARSMDAKRRQDETSALKRRLDEALRRENYEDAAKLRDQLKRLKA